MDRFRLSCYSVGLTLIMAVIGVVSAASAERQKSRYHCNQCQYDCNCPYPPFFYPHGSPPIPPGAPPMPQRDENGELVPLPEGEEREDRDDADTASPEESLSPEDVDLQQQAQGAQDFGAVGGAAGATGGAPGTLGDLGGGTLVVGPGFSFFHAGNNIGLAAGDRRYKIVENTSPLPQDRLFFNFNHFDSALVASDQSQVDLQRYLFGWEHTFLYGTASTQLTIPFASGVASQSISDEGSTATEFGNIGLTIKGLLYKDRCSVVSAGLGMVFPTAEDASFVNESDETLFVDNGAYHLQPFLSMLHQPSNRAFLQTVFQLDFDTSGNDFTDGIDSGNIKDPTLLYASGSMGYWVYRSCCCRNWIQGIAPMVELHYTTTVEDPDTDPTASGPSDALLLFRDNRFDILNLTGGLHIAIRQHASLRIIGTMPLREKENPYVNSMTTFSGDRLFDAEVAVQFNYGY